MSEPPAAPDELARLSALASYQVLDTPPEQGFDDLARLAARLCGTQVGLVGLVAGERVWFKAAFGMRLQELPRAQFFDSHALGASDVMEVADAAADPRFSASPLVAGGPRIRFYAGAPFRTPEGHALGALSVLDGSPRRLTADQRDALVVLARQAMRLLELGRAGQELKRTARERTGVQRALRESEERYRDLFEGASDLIQAVAPDGRLVYTNRAWRDTLGYAAEEIAELRLFDLIDPGHRAEAADLMQWVLEGGDVDTAEMVFRSKDGRHIVAEGSLSCKRVDGQPVVTRAILRDVTERRRAEERLRASEARTRSIIENMIGALITIDARGSIETVNPAAEWIFGYRRDELVGQTLGLLLPEPADGDKGSLLRSIFAKSLGRITEWQGRRKNGELFPFELSLFEFETEAGRQFACNIRDASERHEVERLKKEFVSTVSHELRTPLTSIRGSLSLLAGGVLGELPAEALEVVEIAERNAVRLIGLINDILDLERLESGRLEMHMSDVAVAEVFERSAEAVAGVAEAHGVAVEIRPTAARVWADPDRLVQVLVNLVGNAVKFSPRGERVTLDAVDAKEQIEVRVVDRGRGIPEAFRDAVFERFKQVEASDAREKGGTGLGLAICKAIVERHGGEIGVLSREGAGSTFYFRIPAGRPAAEERPRAS